MQLKACIKKDFIEIFKTKKWFALFFASIGCALLSALIIVIFKVLQSSGVDVSSFTGGDAELASLFAMTYSTSFMYFAIYLTTYFTIVMIVFYGGIFSKEIKEKKWIMPLSCGIKAENLVLSKVIVNFVGLFVTLLTGCLLNFIFSLTLCTSGGLSVGTLLLYYLMVITFVLFMYVLAICLNAITKNNKIAIVVSIVALILLPEILSMISIANVSLVNYTPYLFLNLVMSAGAVGLNTISAIEYIAASVTTIGIISLLVVLALSFNKIKKIEK